MEALKTNEEAETERRKRTAMAEEAFHESRAYSLRTLSSKTSQDVLEQIVKLGKNGSP